MKIIPLPGRSTARPSLWQVLRQEQRLLWGLVLTAVLAGLLASRIVPDKVALQPGDTAPHDIRARRSRTYVSAIATQRARQAAAGRVPRQYDNDPRAANEAGRLVSTVFNVISTEKANPRSPELSKRLAEAQQALPANVNLSPAVLKTALEASDPALEDLMNRTQQVVAQVMDSDIRSDNDSVDSARRMAQEFAAGLHLNPEATRLVSEVAKSAVRPNRILSVTATANEQDRAMRAVSPVEVSIQRDEVITRKGDIVTEQDVERYNALGLQHPGLDLPRLAGLCLFLGGVVLAASFFLRYYEPRIYKDLRLLRLLGILVIFGAAGLKAGYSFLGVPLSASQLGYLATLWIALPAMLAAVLINVDSALLISTLLAVTAGVAWEIEARYLAVALVGSLVGIYGVSRIRDRNDLMRVAATVSLTNVFLVVVLGLLYGDAHTEILIGMAWVLGTGVASALLFWLMVAILERPFGLVTHIGLLELSDMNRELLRRLQWEAPGTYHHSLGVAVLAESAAEAIGADALLARVAAYYHDIGKMRRPQYFAENQAEGNVHDNLAPTLSTIAITAHVKEGLELAKQYHLPPQVRDGINQHHGTSLVSFFYHQATGGEIHNDTLEQQFRYEGPKPQSREMAILMLADNVEAISRTVEKPTPQKIEQTIDTIIQAKLNDGQFDECDLTFRDIGGIKAAFVRTLVSMLHTRIEYPGVPGQDDAARAEGENGHRNGNGDHGTKDAPGEAAPPAPDSPDREPAAN